MRKVFLRSLIALTFTMSIVTNSFAVQNSLWSQVKRTFKKSAPNNTLALEKVEEELSDLNKIKYNEGIKKFVDQYSSEVFNQILQVKALANKYREMVENKVNNEEKEAIKNCKTSEELVEYLKHIGADKNKAFILGLYWSSLSLKLTSEKIDEVLKNYELNKTVQENDKQQYKDKKENKGKLEEEKRKKVEQEKQAKHNIYPTETGVLHKRVFELNDVNDNISIDLKNINGQGPAATVEDGERILYNVIAQVGKTNILSLNIDKNDILTIKVRDKKEIKDTVKVCLLAARESSQSKQTRIMFEVKINTIKNKVEKENNEVKDNKQKLEEEKRKKAEQEKQAKHNIYPTQTGVLHKRVFELNDVNDNISIDLKNINGQGPAVTVEDGERILYNVIAQVGKTNILSLDIDKNDILTIKVRDKKEIKDTVKVCLLAARESSQSKQTRIMFEVKINTIKNKVEKENNEVKDNKQKLEEEKRKKVEQEKQAKHNIYPTETGVLHKRVFELNDVNDNISIDLKNINGQGPAATVEDGERILYNVIAQVGKTNILSLDIDKNDILTIKVRDKKEIKDTVKVCLLAARESSQSKQTRIMFEVKLNTIKNKVIEKSKEVEIKSELVDKFVIGREATNQQGYLVFKLEGKKLTKNQTITVAGKLINLVIGDDSSSIKSKILKALENDPTWNFETGYVVVEEKGSSVKFKCREIKKNVNKLAIGTDEIVFSQYDETMGDLGQERVKEKCHVTITKGTSKDETLTLRIKGKAGINIGTVSVDVKKEDSTSDIAKKVENAFKNNSSFTKYFNIDLDESNSRVILTQKIANNFGTTVELVK